MFLKNFKWNSCGSILYAWNCSHKQYYWSFFLICSFKNWLHSCRRLNKNKEENFLFHFWFLLSFLTWHLCLTVNCCQRPLNYLRRTYIPRLQWYMSDRKIRVWREWSVIFFPQFLIVIFKEGICLFWSSESSLRHFS